MNITDQTEFWDAQIININLKLKEGLFITNELTIRTGFTRELAQHLGVEHMIFHETGTIRDGFTFISLDLAIPMYRALFQIDGLHQELVLNGDTCSKFEVERNLEGLRLNFRMSFKDEPFSTIAYIKETGAGLALLKITPLQEKLDLSSPEAVADEVIVTTRDRKKHRTPVPPQAMEQAQLNVKVAKGRPS